MDLNGMFHGKYDHTWGYPGDDRDKLSNTPRNETLIGSMGSIVSIDLGNPCSPVVDIVEATWIWQKNLHRELSTHFLPERRVVDMTAMWCLRLSLPFDCG